MRANFVEKSEKFLVWYEHGEHVSDVAEIRTASDAISYSDMRVLKFFRVDAAWNFEDVTEDVARAWLQENSDNPDNMTLPGRWFEESDVWSDFLQSQGERSDYDEHNTLNHAQQGISRR